MPNLCLYSGTTRQYVQKGGIWVEEEEDEGEGVIHWLATQSRHPINGQQITGGCCAYLMRRQGRGERAWGAGGVGGGGGGYQWPAVGLSPLPLSVVVSGPLIRTLISANYRVCLVGRRRHPSPPVPDMGMGGGRGGFGDKGGGGMEGGLTHLEARGYGRQVGWRGQGGLGGVGVQWPRERKCTKSCIGKRRSGWLSNENKKGRFRRT